MARESAKRNETVTFVGDYQAKVGFRFVVSDPPEVCRNCRLFNACMSRLALGRVYEVVEVKEKEHFCPLYEGKVKVVKVVEAPVEVLVKPNLAVEGATVEAAIEDCGKKCPLDRLCNPVWCMPGRKIKVKILNVGEDLSEKAVCGKRLKKVEGMVAEDS